MMSRYEKNQTREKKAQTEKKQLVVRERWQLPKTQDPQPSGKTFDENGGHLNFTNCKEDKA